MWDDITRQKIDKEENTHLAAEGHHIGEGARESIKEVKRDWSVGKWPSGRAQYDDKQGAHKM